MILVGNKTDLEYERKVWKKTAQLDAAALGIKYFEVSAKSSSKDEIDAIIYELIDMNEMDRFNIARESSKSSKWWQPCENEQCKIIWKEAFQRDWILIFIYSVLSYDFNLIKVSISILAMGTLVIVLS